MRIAFLHGSNDLYGASRVLIDDCRLLVAEGHEVEVLLPVDGALTQRLMEVGAAVTVAPLRVLRLSKRSSLLTPPLARPRWREPPDVVVVWTLALAGYLPALRMAGHRVLVSVHELLPSSAG